MKAIDWVVYVFQALALIAAGIAATLSFLAGNTFTGIIWIVIAVLWAVNIGVRIYFKLKRRK